MSTLSKNIIDMRKIVKSESTSLQSLTDKKYDSKHKDSCVQLPLKSICKSDG